MGILHKQPVKPPKFQKMIILFRIKNIFFFEVCFKCVHDRKKNNNHKKEKIDLFIPIDTTCPDHERSPMNLFCIDEKGNNK